MEQKPLVLMSSEPLPNKMKKLKKLYWVGIGICAVGVLFAPIIAVGILFLACLYLVDTVMVSQHRGKLRILKFKYDNSISFDELFPKLQERLISKFKGAMLLERNENGGITISYDDHIYDMHINPDGTFCLWWRKSLGKAFLSFSDYKSYKKILNGMGILAYEIQQCCDVNK